MAFDQRYQPGAIPQFGSFGPPNMSAQLQAGISKLADPFIARLRELQIANEAAAARKDTESIFKPTSTAAPGAAGGPAQTQTAAGDSPAGAPSFAGGRASRSMSMPTDPALAPAIVKHATAAGLDPADLATAMSYETGGTFNPWQKGPTTKWGEHRGLIQWGEPQRAQYGVGANTPVEQQVEAAVKYLQDRGVKPGHGLLEIYSAINAGGVGSDYYGRSDRAAGGAPGTVADKVANQMAGHRRNAERLLANAPQTSFAPSVTPAPTPAAQAAVTAPGPAMDAATGRAIPSNDPRLQTPEFDRVHGQAPTQVASLDPSIGIGQRPAAPEVAPRPVRPQSFGPDGQPLPPQQQPAPPLPSGPPPNEQPTPPPPPPVQPPPPPVPPVEPPPPAPMAALPTPAAPPAPRVAPAVAPSPEQTVAAGGPQQPPVRMAQAAPQQGQRYVAPVDPVAERFWLTQLKHAKTREEVVGIGQKLMELRQGQKRTVHITPQGLVEYDPNEGKAKFLTTSPDRAPKTAKGPDGREYAWNEARGGYVDPVGPPEAGAARMFSGNSVEGQGLNHLVERGILTRDQAATVAAGKTVTDPSTNTQFFIPPQDLARGGSIGVVARTPDGATMPVVPQSTPAAPAAPAVAPAASAPSPGGATAVPPPTPGAVQLTPPKADKPDNPSAEAAARVSLGNTFLKEVPAIRQQIEAGVLDSPKARAALVAGYGDPGSIARRMASGRDALLRAMTGAGMNLSEAADYVKRYELSWRDNRRNFLEKLEGLERDIIAVREGVVAGRKITAPALTGPPKSSGSGGFTTPGGTRFEEVR